MGELVKTNIPGYMKDTETHAVINTNESEYLKYKEEVKRALEIKKMGDELNNLKTEMTEIKDMLKTIAQAVKNG